MGMNSRKRYNNRHYKKGGEAVYECTAGMYYPKIREEYCGLEDPNRSFSPSLTKSALKNR
ncbi:hypothetical protein F180042I2_19610 [Enterocloster bolteae]